MPNSADQKTYGLFSTAGNAKLIRELENAGAKIFKFPPVETEPVVADETSLDCLQNLTNFDWVIFPDVFAVEYFLQALELHGVDVFELDAVRVLALGEAVADRLRFVQLHADLIPNFVETGSVLQTLLNFIGPNSLEKSRFLMPKEVFARLEIAQNLSEKDASVTELPVYRAAISDKTEVSRLKVLLTGGAIDEFIFSSPEDLISLKYIFSDERITTILSEIEVSATSELMMRTLKEHNQKSKFRRPY